MDLVLNVRKKWFEQYKAGNKPFEYRLNNEYWRKRLEGKNYINIIYCLGYPKASDTERRIVMPYKGFELQHVTSEEWGNVPQHVYGIRLTPPVESSNQQDK